MQPELAVFTLTSDLNHPGLIKLLRSAHRFGWPLNPIYTNRVDGYDDYIFRKHQMIRQQLKDFKTQHYSRFLFLDAWDTLFTGRMPAFGLQEQKEDVLCFGAELNCHPNHQLVLSYPPKDLITEFPFLNSGVIWGHIDTYLELCPLEQKHDQEAWTEAYLARPERFFLDHQAKVALNLHSTNIMDISRYPDGIRYNPTGTWPCIVHGNGKWPIPNFMEELR